MPRNSMTAAPLRTQIGTAARLFALALVVVVMATACASSAASTNYVAIDSSDDASTGDDTSTSGVTTSSTSASGQVVTAADPVADARGAIQGRPVPATTIAEITSQWDRFLTDRAMILIGQADLELLTPTATDAGRQQVAAIARENAQRVATDELTGLTQLLEWSNIETIVEGVEPGRVQFLDCTERHRVNVLGRESVVFVTNVVNAVLIDDTWRIDAVEPIQNGVIGLTNDDLGCVPPSFAERALRTATDAVDLAAGYADNPDVAGTVAPVFQDRARETLELALLEMQLQGLRRSPDERVRLEVLGMDLNRPDFTVVVEVCRQYPNGRSFVNETGTLTAPDLAPGESVAERLFVFLEPATDPTLDAVTDIDTASIGCWADA